MLCFLHIRVRDVFVRFDFDGGGAFDAEELFVMMEICNLMGKDRKVTMVMKFWGRIKGSCRGSTRRFF